MKRKSTKPIRAAGILAALAVTLLTLLLPCQTTAYVLEGPHILDLTAQAMGRIAALRVNQKLLIYPQAPEDTPTVFDETAIYVMPHRFRSDIASEQIRRTHLEFANDSLTVIDGRIAAGKDPFDLYQRLLRSRTRSQLMRTLNTLGVQTAITSLGRIDEKVVFVLGAHYPDESVSQLAVDQETFIPVRLLLTNASTEDPGRHLEIYYQNWRKLQDGLFPLQISFYVNGQLSREIVVVSTHLNPTIPPDLMDLEALKASVAVTDGNAPGERKREAVEEVQKGVQDFLKKMD